MPIALIIFVTLFVITVTHKELINKKWAKNLRIFLVYDLAAFCIIYPISDYSHFAIGSICIILTMIYLGYEAIEYFDKSKDMNKTVFELKKFSKVIAILLLLGYMVISAFRTMNYVIDIKKQTYLNHFKYIETAESLSDKIKQVDKYVLEKREEGKEVYMLNSMAAVYMIPIDEYHKNYDMFNLGNFGGKGEEGIIDDLKSKDNLILLVLKDEYYQNWQMPQNVIYYVQNNCKRTGSITIFDIYEK